MLGILCGVAVSITCWAWFQRRRFWSWLPILLDMLFSRLFAETDKITEGWVTGWVTCCSTLLELKFLFNLLAFCNKFISKSFGMDTILLAEDWEEEECLCCGCIPEFVARDADALPRELKPEFISLPNLIPEVLDVEVGLRRRCPSRVRKNWLDPLLWGKFRVLRRVAVVCGRLLENVFTDRDGAMLRIDRWLKEKDWKTIHNCNQCAIDTKTQLST